MEQAREARDREQAEAAAGEAEQDEGAEWAGEAVLQQGRAVIACAPTVVKGCRINRGALAISFSVRNAGRL